MKLTQMTLAACAALLLSNVAIAAPAEFKKADANADGMVDAAEYAKSGAAKPMAEIDKDKNGSLSKKEYDVLLEEECD
jgi:hypothetical protein